jgi:biopolymer transport protein ExbD
MVPLIDMFFLLLTFFIFGVFSLSRQHGIRVDLPTASTGAVSKEEPVAISVTADGGLRVGERPATLGTLPGVLQEAVAGNAEQVVLIHADQNARHGLVLAVLDTVRQAGIGRVTFQVEPAS